MHDTLLSDVQPQDLLIGGVAVQDVLQRRGSYYYIGPAPDADVTLEHWSTDGELVVRPTERRNDQATRANAGMLARQIRGTGSWIPGVSERRTAKIAQLAGGVSALSVAILDIGHSKSIDDAAIQGWRAEARAAQRGDNDAVRTLWLDDKVLAQTSREAIAAQADGLAHSKYGWAHIARVRAEHADDASWEDAMGRAVMESFQVQADAQPTVEELAEQGQRLVDRRLDDLTTKLDTLRVALAVVRGGDRVRSSK